MFLLFSLLPAGSGFGAGLNPDALRVWIEALSDAAPEETAAALTLQLRRVRRAVNRHARLRMLDMLVPPTLHLTTLFEAELHRARHPLSLALQRRIVAANELLKQHAACYRETAAELSATWLGLGFSRVLPRAVAQGMELERRRLVLAFRAYSPGSKSAWQSLHKLYRIARSGGYADRCAEGACAAPTLLYAKSLLLAFAEPARLGVNELDRVLFYLDRHAALAELHDAQGSVRDLADRDGCFLIRRRDDGPGQSLRKRQSPRVAGGDLVLDCGPLMKHLRAQIDGIEHGVQPSRLGLPAIARRPVYVALLRNLLTLWNTPPQRRHPRQRFRPRIDLVSGFDDVWALIDGPAFGRRNDDARSPAAPAVGEWAISNEGPVGFALQYLSGASGDLSVGALTGLRPKDRSVVYVCIVRRLVGGGLRPELGLQKLAPLAVPTMVSLRGTGTGGSTASKAIVLLGVPGLNGGAAVIVRSGVLQSGMRVPFRHGEQRLTGQAGAPMERGPNYDIFTLDIVA